MKKKHLSDLCIKISIFLFCSLVVSCLNPLEAPDVENNVEIIIGYNPDDTVDPAAARTVTPIGFQNGLDYLIRFQEQDTNPTVNHYFTISQGSISRRIVIDPGQYHIDVVGFVGGTISGATPKLGETVGSPTSVVAAFDAWTAQSQSDGVFVVDGPNEIPWQVADVWDKIVATGQTINGNTPNQVDIPRGDILKIPVPLIGFTDKVAATSLGSLNYNLMLPGQMTGKDSNGGDDNTYDQAWLEWTSTEVIASTGETNIYNADSSDASYTGIDDVDELAAWADDGHEGSVSADALYLITSGLLGYRWVGPTYTAADFVVAYKKIDFFPPNATPVTNPDTSDTDAAVVPGFYTVKAGVIKRIDDEDVRRATITDTMHIYQGATTYLDWTITDDMLANNPGGVVNINYNDAGDDLFETDLVTLYKSWDDENNTYDWTSPQQQVTLLWNKTAWTSHGFGNFKIEIDGERWNNSGITPAFASGLVEGGSASSIVSSTGFIFRVSDFQVGDHTFTLSAEDNASPPVTWTKTITIRSERGPGLWQGNRLVKTLTTDSGTAPAPAPGSINEYFLTNALYHINNTTAPNDTNWYINFTDAQAVTAALTLKANQNITISGIAATTDNVYQSSWPYIQLVTPLATLATVGASQRLTLTGQMSIRGNIASSSRMITVNNASGILVLGGNVRLMNQGAGALSLSAGSVYMNDLATITGNSSSQGAGVYITDGSFTMNGGIIAGNVASTYGGGIYIGPNTDRFAKNGGIIYGSDDPTNYNTAATDGAALNYNAAVAGARNRNKTIGTGDKLLLVAGTWTLWNNDPPD
ncbi:MAG: hypothetical protein LBM77_03680 [Spirochaetaceae bacterium]|nr:hypothetical protein [Spirochaetaceae bacterium]